MPAITYQFAPLPVSVLLDNNLPSTYKTLFSYLLYRTNIPGWIIRKTDIANQLNISLSTVKRGLRALRKLGYATYDLVAQWTLYPDRLQESAPKNSPKGSEMTPLEEVKNDPLIYKDSLEKKKQQQAPLPEPIQKAVVVLEEEKEELTYPVQKAVVVLEEEKEDLTYPVQLNPDQKKDAKHHIKKAPLELQQDVLFELLYRLTKSKIINPIGYLKTLIKAANGEFPAFIYKLDKAFMASINKTTVELKQPPKALPFANNDDHFRDLIKKYGERARVAIYAVCQDPAWEPA